jgi:hypothetical protein
LLVISPSILSLAVAPASVYEVPTSTVTEGSPSRVMTGMVVSKKLSPEFQEPASSPSEPKSIGLSVPTATASYITFPVVESKLRLEAVKSAATIEVAKESSAARFGVIFLVNELIKFNSTLAITPKSEGTSVVPLVTKFP